MRGKIHRAASRELSEAIVYYDRERSGYGDRFVAAFATGRDFLLQFPNSGRPHLLGSRVWKLIGFPYNIVYVIRGDVVFIIAIAHYRRQRGYWRSRLR
jgi:hypothetical protein